MVAKLKITEKYFLYGWLDSEKLMHNIGKKVSKKLLYLTSVSAGQWWSRFTDGKMEQYCIIESDDRDIISACEWFALDYGFKVLGKKCFYNKTNNASKGDQSLVTKEMKQAVMDYFDGKLTPITNEAPFPLHVNILNKVIGGEYDIVNIPTFKLEQYGFLQVREERDNQAGIKAITESWMENPTQTMADMDPIAIVKTADGFKLINGNTRLGFASANKINELPAVIIDEEEFGSTEKERNQCYVLFGGFANAEDKVYRKPNTDGDLIHQMLSWLALEGISTQNILNDKLAKAAVTDLLKIHFKHHCPTMKKLIGVIGKMFTKLEEDEAEIAVQENLLTYSESELMKYKIHNYETKGIPAVVTTMSSVNEMKCIGYIRNRAHQFPEATKFALVLYYASKKEYHNERKEKNLEKVKQSIKRFGDQIVIDVLPAFAKK